MCYRSGWRAKPTPPYGSLPNEWGRNLIFRPEFRADFSDDAVFNGESQQYTAGIDVIVKL